jgi:hypothetical protein
VSTYGHVLGWVGLAVAYGLILGAVLLLVCRWIGRLRERAYRRRVARAHRLRMRARSSFDGYPVFDDQADPIDLIRPRLSDESALALAEALQIATRRDDAA